ncbi:hypothetical protein M5689_003628 [Euphorbia peplus]|nr:hypothetical protein M5689_003628 [Euphorbia peplus]
MQKQDHPLGICQKVFKFINTLFSPHPKTATYQEDEERSSKDENSSSGSAVQVHFSQSDDQDSGFCTLDSQHPEFKKTKNQELSSQVRRRRKGAEPKLGEEGGIHKSISIQENEEEPKLTYRPHLISVAPNINEKSESFITTRKEAMRRNLDFDFDFEPQLYYS